MSEKTLARVHPKKRPNPLLPPPKPRPSILGGGDLIHSCAWTHQMWSACLCVHTHTLFNFSKILIQLLHLWEKLQFMYNLSEEGGCNSELGKKNNTHWGIDDESQSAPKSIKSNHTIPNFVKISSFVILPQQGFLEWFWMRIFGGAS